jgi:hypothetical protein
MGFRDKDESALNRIVSQIDGGFGREDTVPQKTMSVHDMLYYRRYNQMRESQQQHFSEPSQQEELSEGYRPLKRRIPLEERTSTDFVESGKNGDPLAIPLAGAQPLKRRVPESLHEMRSRVRVDEVEDPAIALEEEARLEAELLARRRQRQAKERVTEDSGSLNESFEGRKKFRKPLNLDMPIANREGMRVSESVESSSREQVEEPEETQRPKGLFEGVRGAHAESDLSGFLRGLGSQITTNPVEESDDRTKEEIYREEQRSRNKLYTEGKPKQAIQEQHVKPRRRIGSQQLLSTSAKDTVKEPIRESESPEISVAVDAAMKRISRKLAEDSPQGIKLFEDILHDYVSRAYVAQEGLEVNPEEF